MIVVNKIETYSLNNIEYTVCKGKLYLIKERQIIPDSTSLSYMPNHKDKITFATCKSDIFRLIRPLIISETEEIKVDDEYLFVKNNTICTADVGDENLVILNKLLKDKQVFKILAFPENFSMELQQKIVDGYLKHNEEIYVECGFKDNFNSSVEEYNSYYTVKFNDTFVTIFKDETIDDIFNHFDFKLWVDTEFVAMESGFWERENDSCPGYSIDQLKLKYLKEYYKIPIKK